MADAVLSKLSSELEDAGLLGGAAASILGFVAFGTDDPGYLVTTATGAVWTKTIANAATHSADIGIGTLTLNGGALTTTAGFAFDEGGLTEFSLLVAFSGATAATPLSLVLPSSVAYLMPAKKDGTKIVGYDVAGPKEAVRLDLPLAGALEITIRRTDDGVQSALGLHGAAADVGLAAQGIFQLDLGDKVLVIPKFLRLGLSIETLFVDLSSSAATPVSGLFPEVYDPRWKGVGAKSIGLHVPVDDKGTEWVNATLDGFLIGFDGKVSLKGAISHKITGPGPTVREVTGELDIRNNEIVKGAFAAEVDLQKAAEATNAAASGSAQPRAERRAAGHRQHRQAGHCAGQVVHRLAVRRQPEMPDAADPHPRGHRRRDRRAGHDRRGDRGAGPAGGAGRRGAGRADPVLARAGGRQLRAALYWGR